MSKTDFLFGLDLGKTSDYSALVGLQRKFVEHPSDCKVMLRYYAVRFLHRWQLGTDYTEIVTDVCAAMERSVAYCGSIGEQERLPFLAVDHTGVGQAVVDFLRKAKPRAMLHPILITSGHKHTMESDGWHVPKKDLVSSLQVCLGTDRIVVGDVEHKKVLTRELNTFTVKVTTAGNETFECLAGGTMIDTEVGQKPINEIRAGEFVWTRNGLRRVVWSGATKKVSTLAKLPLPSGCTLAGTPDHLIWTENRAWVELASVTEDDMLCLRRRPKLSSSKALSTPRFQATRTTTIRNRNTLCTEPSGSISTDQFCQDATSITRMKIPRTTTFLTWCASPRANTPGSISVASRQSVESVLAVEVHSPLVAFDVAATGTRDHGTAPCPAPSRVFNRSRMIVFNVGIDLKAAGTVAAEWSGSAPAPVRPQMSIRGGGCQKNRVMGVGSSSGQSIEFHDFVRPVARPVIVSCSKQQPVYDLVVEDDHEFFANGVLVHNSWRERDHDDLVLAAVCALWLGERGQPFQAPREIPNFTRPHRVEDRRRQFGANWNRKGLFGST